MAYQNSAVRLASPAPTFEAVIADATRQMSRSARLSDKDRQLMWDLQRGRGLVTIGRLFTIARSCSSLADALALPHGLQGFVLAGHPAITCDTSTALREAVCADTNEIVAIHEYAMSRTHANRERLIESLTRQQAAGTSTLEALQHAGYVRALELVHS
jgi:hypothetical protein